MKPRSLCDEEISANGGHEVEDRTWHKGWISKAYLKTLPGWSSLALAKAAGLGQAQCWEVLLEDSQRNQEK